MSATEFCIRACKEEPAGPGLCNHIYDTMGCEWNMPGNYNAGTFENCLGDSGPVSTRAAGPMTGLLIHTRGIAHGCLRYFHLLPRGSRNSSGPSGSSNVLLYTGQHHWRASLYQFQSQTNHDIECVRCPPSVLPARLTIFFQLLLVQLPLQRLYVVSSLPAGYPILTPFLSSHRTPSPAMRTVVPRLDLGWTSSVLALLRFSWV